MLHDLLGPGLRGLVGQGELLLELLLKLKKKRLFRPLVPKAPPLQGLPEAEDGVLGPPGLLFLFAAVAGGVVGGGVRGEAVGEGLEEGGAFPLPGPFHRLLGLQVHGEGVVPVHHHPRHPVPLGPSGHVVHLHLPAPGDADGVAVVLHQEDHGSAQDRGEVQPLVEVPLAGAPVPDGGGHHPVLPRCRPARARPTAWGIWVAMGM